MIYFYDFIKKIVLLLFIYFLSRLFFILNNLNLLDSISEIDFSFLMLIIESLRFDLSILLYINSFVFLLLIFPHNLHRYLWYRKFIRFTFLIVNIPFIVLNNIDIEFFQYNQKRITSDFLDLIFLGNDTLQIFPNYLIQYWPLVILSFFQFFLITRISDYKFENVLFSFRSILKSILVFIIATSLFIIGARGGLQLKPIKVVNAGQMSNPIFSNIVLNTPFCLLHSLNSNKLNEYEYFNVNELDPKFSDIKSNSINSNFSEKNVVVIIMESLSKEFVGYYNNHNLTPFIDSLISQSLVFNNTFSNGLRSIEALPAITASIPTLSKTPFITSIYAQNDFNSLASILSDEGYATSFFHGGTRGTMGFYGFVKKAGFENYFGLEEYDNYKDYDGTWGIYDEPFFKYFAKKLKSTKEPFFSTFFSLSAHPPYSLPEKYVDVFSKGELAIHELISYSDFSLKKFFDEIKNEKWFNNTIFVITADHTSPKSADSDYKNRIGRYSIPLFFYTPDNSLKGQSNVITQHIDIMPSLLDALGYNKPYFSFGESVFYKDSWAIHKNNKRYCLITEKGILNNINENYSTFSDWRLKNRIQNNTDNIKFLKSFKQHYSKSMIYNKLNVENEL